MQNASLAVQHAVALLVARRGGRSVPTAELLRWIEGDGIDASEALAALDALLDARALVRDDDGWRPRALPRQSRSVLPMADGARFRT